MLLSCWNTPCASECPFERPSVLPLAFYVPSWTSGLEEAFGVFDQNMTLLKLELYPSRHPLLYYLLWGGKPMSSPIGSVWVLICILQHKQTFSIDHWTPRGENYCLMHWQVFGISLISYDIVHPLTISSSTPGWSSVISLAPSLCPALSYRQVFGLFSGESF